MRGVKSCEVDKRQRSKDRVLVLYVLDDKSVSEISMLTAVPRRTINNWVKPYLNDKNYSLAERVELGRVVARTCISLGMSLNGLKDYLAVSRNCALDYIDGKSIPSDDRREWILELINRRRGRSVFSSWQDLMDDINFRVKSYGYNSPSLNTSSNSLEQKI
ncbi:MAG: hypothetical protein AABW73_00115 [Nanoarchaeota archaeon]